MPVNEWLVTLAPKRTGRLVIPAISLAGLSTAPVAVNVVPSTGGALTDERTLFVRLEAGDVQPFVQSDVPVTVRVYDRLGCGAAASAAFPPTAPASRRRANSGPITGPSAATVIRSSNRAI